MLSSSVEKNIVNEAGRRFNALRLVACGALLTLDFAAASPHVAGQQVSIPEGPSTGAVTAPRLDTPWDGRIQASFDSAAGTQVLMADLLRAGFARAEGFVEQVPDDGARPDFPTDAFVAYDGDGLRVVLVAHDPEPHLIRAHMAPRENVGADDGVTLFLDTDGARRRAYAFRSNPLGIQWDALWTEGQGFDTSFDAVWSSRGVLLADGYAVAFGIPFKTLRFDVSGRAPWGIVFRRTVPRGEGETSYWPRVSSEVQGTLTQAASLVGVQGVEPGRNVQGIGYVNARRFRALDPRATGGPVYVEDDFEGEAGADLKAVFDDRFVLDLTVNPDFSQIESDQPQVSVNRRFELFFPERRPFFTENADYFQTPINLLFTRRIADPRLGARFTGRAGAWGLGGLAIDDEAPGRLAPLGHPLAGQRATFSAVRFTRDLGDFSRIGGIFVGRELMEASNRVVGLDGRVRFNDHWTGSAQVASSDSGDPTGHGFGGHDVSLPFRSHGVVLRLPSGVLPGLRPKGRVRHPDRRGPYIALRQLLLSASERPALLGA